LDEQRRTIDARSLGQLLEEVPDYAIFLLDAEGRVVTWGAGPARVKGYEADEIMGRSIAMFYPPADVAAGTPERELQAAVAAGRYQVEGWRVRRDGSRYWATVVLIPLRDDAGGLVGFAKITRDVTARKQREDRLRAVLAVAQATLHVSEEEDLLELIARRGRELVDADLAAVLLTVPGGEVLAVRAAVGPGSADIRGRTLPLRETVAGGVVTSGRQVKFHLADLARMNRHSLLEPTGLEEVVIVPLITGMHHLGALAVGNLPGRPGLTPAESELVELYAAQAAVAIDYGRAREEVQRLAILHDRERIGRELHDGAIQSLFAVGMGLQGMSMMTDDAALRDRLDTAVTQIDEVIRDLRSYIFGLRPAAVADRQLGLALEALARDFENRHGVACAVHIDAATAARLAGRAADVLQVAREALSNVGRHARAATCRLSLRQVDGRAELTIEDDGRGFVPEAAGGGGWGLRNLGERATELGGALEVTSVPDEGTRLTLSVPL
jgi:PAS domain S-box-containing protein